MFTASSSLVTRRATPLFRGPVPLRLCDWGVGIQLLVIPLALVSLISFELSLAGILLVGYALLTMGLFKPGLGVMGCGILATVDAPSRILIMHGGLLRWSTFNYVLFAVIIWSLPWLVRSRGLAVRSLQLLLVVMLAQLAMSSDVPEGVATLFNVLIFFGFLAYFMRACESVAVWYFTAFICGSLGAVLGGTFLVRGHSMLASEANMWIYLPLTALFAICLGFRFSLHRFSASLCLGLLALTNAGWVFISGSRGGLLIALICLAYLCVEVRCWVRRWLAAALVTCIAIIGVFLVPQVIDRTISRLELLVSSDVDSRHRTSGRGDLAYGGWKIFRDSPLGVGTGGFEVAWKQLEHYEGMSTYSAGQEKSAHSAWVKTLAENGLQGVILLGAFVVSFALLGLRRRRRDMVALGVFVTVLLGFAFIPHEFTGTGLWFLAAGALAQLAAAISTDNTTFRAEDSAGPAVELCIR